MSVKLSVPYISQLEPNGLGFNNCGPACLTMQLAYNGLVNADREAMHSVADYIRDGVYDGDWWLGTYTDYPMMADLARRIYKTESATLLTWDEIFAALDALQPVMLLVNNAFVQPRQYPASAAFNADHFILLTGYDAFDFSVNDPLSVYVGGPSYYTGASVREAVTETHDGIVYAFALTATVVVPEPPSDRPPPPWDGPWMVLAQQKQDLETELAAIRRAYEGLQGDHGKVLADRDYNFNVKMALEADRRWREGRSTYVAKRSTDKLIATIPQPQP